MSIKVLFSRRRVRKLIRLASPFLFALLFFYKLQHERSQRLMDLESMLEKAKSGDSGSLEALSKIIATAPRLAESEHLMEHMDIPEVEVKDGTEDSSENSSIPDRGNYREIFSLTTRDRKFFPIYWNGDTAYNPNIIPHPTKHDLWIIVAQHEQSGETIDNSEQFVCTAGFLDEVMVCTAQPDVLPVDPSVTGQCFDDLAYFNFRHGPRDARMFYSPDVPYLVYGSQSQYACLGIWMNDLRQLVEPFHVEQGTGNNLFQSATEIRRPAPWHGIEKNFFMFWDSDGKMYAHYDLWPKRAFAQVDFDGSVGQDLAQETLFHDTTCIAQYMPSVGPEHESIHQATNSLRITLCKREDPGCVPNDGNTFIMHIFHHKSYYNFHGEYEPFIMLFQQSAPFALYAISQRPLWIHGRNALTAATGSIQYRGSEEYIPEGHTEMFYVTSISWKTHGQKYHGYMDDTMFLSFGIEDTRSGAIDIRADDLLQDLAFCESLERDQDDDYEDYGDQED